MTHGHGHLPYIVTRYLLYKPYYAVSTQSMDTTALEGNRLWKHRMAKDAYVAICSGRMESVNSRLRFSVRTHTLEVLNEKDSESN